MLFDLKCIYFVGILLNMFIKKNYEVDILFLFLRMLLEFFKRLRGFGFFVDLGFRNLDKFFLSLLMSGFSDDYVL